MPHLSQSRQFGLDGLNFNDRLDRWLLVDRHNILLGDDNRLCLSRFFFLVLEGFLSCDNDVALRGNNVFFQFLDNTLTNLFHDLFHIRHGF